MVFIRFLTGRFLVHNLSICYVCLPLRIAVLFSTVLSLSGHAQALTPTVAPPSVFVGLGAGYLSYQMPGQFTVNLPSVVPTVGVMFNPRW